MYCSLSNNSEVASEYVFTVLVAERATDCDFSEFERTSTWGKALAKRKGET